MRLLDFSDGFTSASSPASGDISATNLPSYASTAAFVSAHGTAQEGDIFHNSTDDFIYEYDGAAWRTYVATTGTQTLTGKSIGDASDATKKISFTLSGATTGKTLTLISAHTNDRSITFPDATDTLVGLATSGTLTNKTINGSNNTITNVSLATGVTGTLPIANGGTGQTTSSGAFNALHPMTTLGDTIYAAALGAATRLAGNTTTTTKYMQQVGDGANSAAPTWSQVSLSAGVTGALPIANGGTGQTSKAAGFDALSPMTTSGDIIYGGASGTGTRLAKGSDGQYLTLSGGLPAWASVSVSPANNICTVDSGNGHGSTNTKIRRFSNTRSTTSDVTYADSAGNGATFTINTAGIYAITYHDRYSTNNASTAITVNGSANTTSATSPITYAQGLRALGQAGANGIISNASWTGYLAVNDVVRAHDDGGNDATDSRCMFSIARIL